MGLMNFKSQVRMPELPIRIMKTELPMMPPWDFQQASQIRVDS